MRVTESCAKCLLDKQAARVKNFPNCQGRGGIYFIRFYANVLFLQISFGFLS